MRDSTLNSPDRLQLPEPTDGMLDRYLAGRLSDVESQRVASVVEQRPEWRRFLWHVQGWLAEPDVPPAPNEKEAFGRFVRMLPANVARPGGERRVGQRWPAVAGVAIGVFGVLIAWAGWHSRAVLHPAVATSSYTTQDGERANIRLLDGTQVTLSVGSRLDVPANFGAGNHTVALTGEALFTVAHHDGRPFTVVAGNTRAQVLGTTFAVRHYATDSNTTVAVQDGRVAVGSVVLTARRLVEVGRHGEATVRKADPAVFEFAAGVLSLDYTSLASAIPVLDRWYDADVRLGSTALAKLPIKGDFKAGSLSDLAEILTVGFDVRVVRNGRTLTLYPRAQE